MSKSKASNPKPDIPQFHFFGGKGGVGKTTCAAAWALTAARAGHGVLIVSTDPAHSLGDALGVRLSSRITRVPVDGPSRRHPAAPALSAVELDAPRAFERWLRDYRQALGDIVEHGTLLDRTDVEELLDLSVPGVDELIGLIEITRLAEQRSAQGPRALVVVDTAPTGHTLRLLAAPQAVGAIATVLHELQREHRLVREQLARVDRPEAADRFIERLAAQAAQTGELLRDPTRTTLHWVTLPEPLAIAETEDGLRALDAARIPVAEVVVNRVLPDGPRCPLCDRRRQEERKVIATAAGSIGKNRSLRIVPAAPAEPRGRDALTAIGKALVSARPVFAFTIAGTRKSNGPIAFSAPDEEGRRALETLHLLSDARLLFFGGKGGVGKTTTAAAAAMHLARAEPAKRVLLLSTDPAHSLADVFRVSLGDRPATVHGAPANLHVRELDAAAALAARRREVDAAIEEIVATFGLDAGVSGGQGVGRLMDLAPPGIDELFGLVSVIELLSPAAAIESPRRHGGEYDWFVIDTAPTGHALRMLEMPDAAREWVQVLMRVLLKYRALVRPGQLASELVHLSKQIRSLQQLMRDPAQTRFVAVTRAAEVPRLETERLLGRLRRMRMRVPLVVVNAMTLAPGRCPQCRATAAAERRQLRLLERACSRRSRDCAIIQTPLAAPPPRGVTALARWARTWTA